MKVVLDLHDFSVANNRLEVLLKLKEHFTNFKVSLFTVPIDKKMDWGPSLIHKDNLEKIKKCLDWMQIIPHGLHHDSSREMETQSYDSFSRKVIPVIQEAFEKDGLPYVNGFCAPHWRWNKDVVKVLDDMGWWGAVLREDKMIKTKKFYRYTHLLNEPFWEFNLEVLKLHGHIYGTKNDIGRCFNNLLKLPKDIEWCYATDFIEEL